MQFQLRSLQQLLGKSASMYCSLTSEEWSVAWDLISNPIYSDKNCRMCRLIGSLDAKAIHDTYLCSNHLRYAFLKK